MPLFEPNPKETQTNQTDNENKPTPKKEETGLIKTLGQLLPLAPLVFEQFTGQKIPAMSGTMAEIQLTLTHIQTGFQTVVNNQQQLAQRIINLETKLAEIQTSANQHLTNLNQQFNSLRLTHTREKKEIAYNNSNHLEE
jgi:hypothetical protein